MTTLISLILGSTGGIGCIGEPEDDASAIERLLEPGNTWVSGQVIGVDGGLAMLPRLPYTVYDLEPHPSAETPDIPYDRHHRGHLDNLRGLIEGAALLKISPLALITRSASSIVSCGAPTRTHANDIWKPHSRTWRAGASPRRISRRSRRRPLCAWEVALRRDEGADHGQ